MPDPDGPLNGVKVLDLTRVLAGPLCGAILGDHGAEVIKVEHPAQGDDTRQWGPRIGQTETTYFNSVNRNKLSLTLDLDHHEGREIAAALASSSDVFIENFKVGGADKLGLGYKRLSELNPMLIYVSISGYDAKRNEAARPGYDLVLQGETGLMFLNGDADQPPLRFGLPMVDFFTAMYAAQAVMAALIQRERTGRGQHIRLALFDCGLTLTSYYGLEALLTAKEPKRCGNGHPSIVPYGVFAAQDGPIVLTIGNDAQFARLCRNVIDEATLVTDPRFVTNELRAKNRPAFLELLANAFSKRTREELLAGLAANGIPCGKVLRLGEALQSERAKSSGMVQTFPHPDAGEISLFAPPFSVDGERYSIRRRPPTLGEHSAEILEQRLKKTPAEIQRLIDEGVVRRTTP